MLYFRFKARFAPNFRYIDFNDDDNDSSAPDTIDYMYFMDSRLWFKAILKPDSADHFGREHSLYVRVKDLVIDRHPTDTAGGSDHEGPLLDYAYLILELRPFGVKAGRAYYSVGQGISYSNVNDGAQLSLSLPSWDFKTFVSHALPHEHNIDLSVPGYDKETDRYYYALECSYLGVPQQNFYGYALAQRDYSNEHPENLLHDYTYSSQYFGLGVAGKIKSAFSYWAELIKETGKSIIYDTNEKKDIDAWARILGLAYEPAAKTHPGFTFEYAYGSGDSDRISVTDTEFGNTSGKDKNFLYFGYIPTGYALSPALSNLYFYRIETSLNPFEGNPWFKDFRFAINYYRYYKDKRSGGIYDLEAIEDSRDIGYEVDASINWQIFSDLSLILQYGYFKPGKAYPITANDSEDYFSVSTTITF